MVIIRTLVVFVVVGFLIGSVVKLPAETDYRLSLSEPLEAKEAGIEEFIQEGISMNTPRQYRILTNYLLLTRLRVRLAEPDGMLEERDLLRRHQICLFDESVLTREEVDRMRGGLRASQSLLLAGLQLFTEDERSLPSSVINDLQSFGLIGKSSDTRTRKQYVLRLVEIERELKKMENQRLLEEQEQLWDALLNEIFAQLNKEDDLRPSLY